MIPWETALFSGQPSLAWIRAFPSPAWSTLMHGAYLSYYAILVAAPLGMWWSGRFGAARETLLLIMVTFYACYTIFLIFPVAGPRYVFPPPRNAATELPLAVLLSLGTVYGQFHYAVDALAGAGVALCVDWLGRRAGYDSAPE